MKKKVRERPKLQPIGERAALRRRIVLSNTNALEVPGMDNWSSENLVDPELVGKVVGLDGALLDQLRDSKAFKTTQNWSLFRRPATLIRSETLGVGQDMEEISSTQEPKTVRHLISGERASGKSILMLQTMCMAYMKKWIVLNAPEAQDLINNTSAYAPLRQAKDKESETEQLYIQPHLSQALLARAASSNASVLNTLKLNHDLPKNLPLKRTATLKELAQLGADDHTLAWLVWQAFWREIKEPGSNPRPPVLLTADGFDHWMGPSKYRSSEHEIIHSQQLQLVRHFTNLMFPNKKTQQEGSPFVNGGMVLYCTTGSNTPAYPTFNLLIDQMRAQARDMSATSSDFPLPKTYSNPDLRILDLVARSEGVKLTDLKGLNAAEAKEYLEYFVRSGLLRAQITDSKVATYRALSGGGMVGELAKFGARITV